MAERRVRGASEVAFAPPHTDDSAAADWSAGEIPLKLQLGDLSFGTLRLRLNRRSATRDETPLAAGQLPALPRAPAPGTQGSVVWSHPLAETLPRLARQARYLLYIPRQYPRYYIDLAGDFASYQAKFSSKSRATIRRKIKKFAEFSGGTIDWRSYRGRGEMQEFFGFAREVSRKTYQERLLDAGLPDGAAFLDELGRAADNDRVRAYLLFGKNTPVAYLYCPVVDGAVRYSHLGYDPAFAAVSPGTVLQWLVLEALFAERRFGIFDFTEGEGEHKKFFATDSYLCGDVFVMETRLSSLAVIGLHHAVTHLSELLGAALDRLGLRARIRRLLRGTEPARGAR